MMRSMRWTLVALALAAPAAAQTFDPVKCQKQIVNQLAKFKKTYLKAVEKCLDFQNAGTVPGPCPDPTDLIGTNDAKAHLKILKVMAKVPDQIAKKCDMTTLATLGFPADCTFEAATAGVEGQCAALPVTTPQQLAACLMCWKQAELAEFTAILYASHAGEVCGNDLGETSPNCSDLECTTPLPDQRRLTGTSSGGEAFCQKGIGKAGVKYLLDREKIFEKCALKGGTRSTCESGSFDPNVPIKLQKAEVKKETTIDNFCGNRNPAPNPPFCCKTPGPPGNDCTVASPNTREQCALDGNEVQNDKTCDTGTNKCVSVQGPNKKITWWGVCPESDCTGTVTMLSDLEACVDTSANAIVDELLCLQLRANGGADWPCPVDTEATTTTTSTSSSTTATTL